MTREEALHKAINIVAYFEAHFAKSKEAREDAVNIIEVLEQEPKTDVLDKIKAEIREWYWQADKQAIAKDSCVVDAMIDLFIRTIDKYKAEKEESHGRTNQ